MSAGRELDGRVALVTGGTRGLGLAIIERLVAEGAQVAVTARDQPDDLPPGVPFFAADQQLTEAADAVVAAVVDRCGRLDVVVNDAGGSPVADVATASPTSSEAVVRQNLLMPLFVAQAANRVMQGQADGGTVLNLASLDGVKPSPGTALYGAAKAGLIHLTSSLAVEWAPKVRVNCVSFDHVRLEGDDGRTAAGVPLGRLGAPAEVADAVVFLVSPASGYVTGTNLVVHGGGDRPAFLAAVAGEEANPAPAEGT